MKSICKTLVILMLTLLFNTNVSAGPAQLLQNTPCPPWCQFQYSAYCQDACPTCYCDPSCAFNCGNCGIE